MSNFLIIADQHLAVIHNIMQAIQDMKRSWQFAEFTNLPEHVWSLQEFSDAIGNKEMSCISDPARHTPYLCTTGDFASFLTNQSANFKYDLKRANITITKHGPWNVRRYSDARSVMQELQTAYSVSRNSWKYKLGTHMDASVSSSNFFTNLCRSDDSNCQPLLWILYCDERPIAIQFHVSDNSSTYMIRNDYDQAFAKLRPGFILQNEVIRDCFSMPIETYFFGGEDYTYTQRYTITTRNHIHATIFNRRLLSKSIFFAKRLKRTLTGRAASGFI